MPATLVDLRSLSALLATGPASRDPKTIRARAATSSFWVVNDAGGRDPRLRGAGWDVEGKFVDKSA
jgi:hypothetical protein